jgi:hypothetical protein
MTKKHELPASVPPWAQDLTAEELQAVRDEAFQVNWRSFYAYASGHRRPGIPLSLRINNMRIALGKPSALHLLRPDVWGPGDQGPPVQ